LLVDRDFVSWRKVGYVCAAHAAGEASAQFLFPVHMFRYVWVSAEEEVSVFSKTDSQSHGYVGVLLKCLVNSLSSFHYVYERIG